MKKRWLTPETAELWRKVPPGNALSVAHPTGSRFSEYKLHPDHPSRTVTSHPHLMHWEEPRSLSDAEYVRVQTFPEDYDFSPSNGPYVCGMSVPPLMMQRVSREVAKMLNPEVTLPDPVTGPWSLRDLREGKLGSPKNGLKVFSCFHCGGGSSMGYKLAGFDVVGGVEIDPEMMKIYRKNLEPRHSYLMGVQDFKKIPDAELPEELLGIDVLDGSPPCSSFSMAGNREKDWGKKKVFREGQADQILDDLFFHFIEIAKKLRPKVVVAENVKGLILGNARGYVKEIFQAFREAGYETQLFLLNAASMGVPQRRERTFFIARRSDLGLPRLNLSFSEKEIPVSQAFQGLQAPDPGEGLGLVDETRKWWSRTPQGQSFSSVHPKGNWFGHVRPDPKRSFPTIVAGTQVYHHSEPRRLSRAEVVRVQSFPEDFEFLEQKPRYVCGMSVPPLMMQRVGLSIAGLFRGGAEREAPGAGAPSSSPS